MGKPTISPENQNILEDLAASCARFVERVVGIAPDGTCDTLPIVDHWLRNVDGGSSDELMRLIVPAAGAYFGEIVRKHFGNVRWRFDGTDYASARLEFENVFLAFNPFAIALEAVVQEDAAGWGAHMQLLLRDHDTVMGSLDNIGDVREEDYFRLGVRFEVIQQVVAVLEDLRSARKEAQTFITPEAYEVERGERAPAVLH